LDESGERTKNSVVVAGGDGTAHELIEGILEGVREKGTDIGRWELIILPLGTVRREDEALLIY
jgi:diacylglycerol kinase family enzyme